MKVSDIPTPPILRYLRDNGGIGCTWFDLGERSVRKAMPDGTPGKLVLAKMRNLIKRGLVRGCTCGCRGDFALTEKGKESVEVSE